MTTHSALPLYDELESLLLRAGAPIDGVLRAPHPDPAAAVRAEMPGAVLPDDLVAWWSWHDGSEPQPLPSGEGHWQMSILGAGWPFLSVEQALAQRRLWLSIAQEVAEPPELTADMIWDKSWLLVLGDQDANLSIDLGAATAAGAPVDYTPQQAFASDAPRIAQTWTEVVQWWVDLLRSGATRWDPAVNLWRTDESLVPSHLVGNPVVYSAPGMQFDRRFNPRSLY